MNWFNYIGLIFIFVLMIPNVIYSIKVKDGFVNKYKNKAMEVFEQIGRFGSFALMVFNIPYTYFNFWFDNGLLVYIIVGSVLLAAYNLVWIICWKRHLIFRAYFLSIVPSVLFLFCGVMLLNIPLIIASIIFAICHITISLNNAYIDN